ncbi:uncharacterized [Tachysurus ichikawai]
MGCRPEQEGRHKSGPGQTAGMSRFVKNKQQLVSECRWAEESSHLVKQSFPSIRKLSLDKQWHYLALLCPYLQPSCSAVHLRHISYQSPCKQ